MHQVMKEQLSIDNKHTAIRKKRYRARKKHADEEIAWRTQLLEADARRRQNLNNWDETWNSGGTSEFPWLILVDKRLRVFDSEHNPANDPTGEQTEEEGANNSAGEHPGSASENRAPEQRNSPGAHEREPKSARFAK